MRFMTGDSPTGNGADRGTEYRIAEPVPIGWQSGDRNYEANMYAGTAYFHPR
jgi:hypothetical protein